MCIAKPVLEEPYVTVIIPVYNGAETVARCLESLRGQTFLDYECFVIDDGSKDKTYEIVSGIAKEDSRIKVIRQENKGVSAARNAGLDEASGKFISFVDADDWLETEYLEQLVNSQMKTDADLTVCEFVNVKNSTGERTQQSVFSSNCLLSGKEAYETVLKKILWNHRKQRLSGPVCKLYRRDILEHFRIRFPDTVSMGEDTLFNLIYAQYVERFCYLHRSFYNRLIHGKSALNRFHPNLIKEMNASYRKYGEIKRKYQWKCDVEKHYIAQGLTGNIIKFYFSHDDYGKRGKRMSREYYEFLAQPLIHELWAEVHLLECADFKEFINVFCVKTHLFSLLVNLYRLKKL